jgi:hypothetical protein
MHAETEEAALHRMSNAFFAFRQAAVFAVVLREKSAQKTIDLFSLRM